MESNTQHVKMLRVGEVAVKLSLGKSTIWAKVKKEVGFPQPVRFSSGWTAWIESELDAYIQSIAATR